MSLCFSGERMPAVHKVVSSCRLLVLSGAQPMLCVHAVCASDYSALIRGPVLLAGLSDSKPHLTACVVNPVYYTSATVSPICLSGVVHRIDHSL